MWGFVLKNRSGFPHVCDIKILNDAPVWFRYEVNRNGQPAYARTAEERFDVETPILIAYLDMKYTSDLFDHEYLARAYTCGSFHNSRHLMRHSLQVITEERMHSPPGDRGSPDRYIRPTPVFPLISGTTVRSAGMVPGLLSGARRAGHETACHQGPEGAGTPERLHQEAQALQRSGLRG